MFLWYQFSSQSHHTLLPITPFNAWGQLSQQKPDTLCPVKMYLQKTATKHNLGHVQWKLPKYFFKINFNFYRLLNVMNVSCITESVQLGGCLTGREVHCCGFSTTFLPMVMHTAALHCSLSTVTQTNFPHVGLTKVYLILSHLSSPQYAGSSTLMSTARTEQ